MLAPCDKKLNQWKAETQPEWFYHDVDGSGYENAEAKKTRELWTPR